MIIYKKVDRTYLPKYDMIPMIVHISSYYRIVKINRGLGGLHLAETPIEPYIKNFCTEHNAIAVSWEQRWDISNWAFFMAFNGDRPVGGATVASRTADLNLLCDRDDLATLWDIRVEDEYKRQGVGHELFDMVVKWCKEQGLVQMNIECQNNNVPAVNFYHKQGAVLAAINEYAYYNEPEYRHEAQFLWYLDL